ncbi:hypothetical protein DWY36_06655 [Firmicutes bacterium AF25-13AC]|nr:hypothetical protein DWY36_06655 [Firmicutes bacterium AF25-13AC]
MKSKWLSELKKIGFLRLGLLAVAAIILIICSLPQNQLSNLNQAQSMGSSLDTDGDTSLFSYEHELEKRLEQILGEMEGITSVDVMITLSATSEKVLEKSIQLEENKQEIEKGSGESLEKSVTSSLNKKNEALLTGNTSGSMPYIIKEMSPSIQGVVVAARGNITQTKIREISEAVQALFGIEAHKIKVIEKKSQAEEAK